MAGESIAEMNSAFAAARADRVNTALQNALSQKALTPPAGAIAPKAAKGKTAAGTPASAAPAATATNAGSTPAVPAAPPPGDGGPSIADVQAALGEPGAEAAPDVAPEPEAPQGEAAGDGEAADEGEAAVGADLAELQELGKKKDLRALEKKLGLEEGSLGVNNGSWKAYRNRLAEVEAKETQHVKNEEALVAKYSAPFQLIEHAKQGDLLSFAKTIEATTGITIARFVQLWSQGVQQVNPREAELERENQRLRGQGKLVEQDGTQTPAAASTAKQVAIEKANTYITAEAKDHPVLRLKDGLDSVRAKWLASYEKSSKTFKLTPKAAADAVVAERRAEREQEQWILSGKTPPKKPTTRALPRAGASETVPRKDNRSRQEIIDSFARQIQQDKARTRKA
jgi:hypothetical protein